MDALTLVRQDHRKVEGLLERSERLEGDDEEERAVLIGQLQTALRHHVDQEEVILFTIFRERARRAEVSLAPLDQAIEQHRLIDRLSRELTEARSGDTREAKLTVLIEQVRNHLDTEDSVLLTAIEDLILHNEIFVARVVFHGTGLQRNQLRQVSAVERQFFNRLTLDEGA